jgi:RNA polymerase sigma-70 factor (ECF subfamily)
VLLFESGDCLLTRSDAELADAVLNGDRSAFAHLVRRYERPVRAVATNILGDKDAADNAAQETFIKAYEKLGSLRSPAAFGPWLLKIARRCALDAVRRKRKTVPLDSLEYTEAVTGNGQLDEAKQELLNAVVRLPGAERQVVMLRYFHQCSVRQVADVCGRSVGTVTKQLSRAHGRLRNMLKGCEL